MRDFFRSHCPWGVVLEPSGEGRVPRRLLLQHVDGRGRPAAAVLAPLHNGVTSTSARGSTHELRKGVWCLGVFDNEHNGAVIGGANMRNYEVIFDRVHRRVGWVPSDWRQLHGGTTASALSGGYSISGCQNLPKVGAAAAAAATSRRRREKTRRRRRRRRPRRRRRRP